MQKAIESKPCGKEPNQENRANSDTGMRIGGGRQFNVLKEIECESNPKMAPEANFRRWGYVNANR